MWVFVEKSKMTRTQWNPDITQCGMLMMNVLSGFSCQQIKPSGWMVFQRWKEKWGLILTN